MKTHFLPTYVSLYRVTDIGRAETGTKKQVYNEPVSDTGCVRYYRRHRKEVEEWVERERIRKHSREEAILNQ